MMTVTKGSILAATSDMDTLLCLNMFFQFLSRLLTCQVVFLTFRYLAVVNWVCHVAVSVNLSLLSI